MFSTNGKKGGYTGELTTTGSPGPETSLSISTMPIITSGTIAVRSTASPSQAHRSAAKAASASAYAVPAGYPVSPSSIASRTARTTGSASGTSISATHSGSTSSG